mgnify:CR=1 FL=1
MNKQELKEFDEYLTKQRAKLTNEDIRRSRKRRAEADARAYKILNQRRKTKRNNNIPTRPMTDEERRELYLI